jgi:hypothetical protein
VPQDDAAQRGELEREEVTNMRGLAGKRVSRCEQGVAKTYRSRVNNEAINEASPFHGKPSLGTSADGAAEL